MFCVQTKFNAFSFFQFVASKKKKKKKHIKTWDL